MIVIRSDKVAFFDVDDTLIEWRPHGELNEPTISLVDVCGTVSLHRILDKNVISLIEHRKRGHRIVVWSAGGYAWAEQAVKLLALEKYVDVVMSKPAWWYDDMTAEEVLLPSQRRFNKGD